MKYTAEYNLEHNEVPAKVNVETGETTTFMKRPNNIPEGKRVFEPDALFRKDYTNSWKFLEKNLKPIEFKAAFALAFKAKANTNSLEPLNDSTTIPQLMEILGLSKNVVKPLLKKLWEIGVYGKFEVAEVGKPYTKYWILNPYLSFSGKLIDSDIAELFSKTHIAKAFKDPNYTIKD